MTDPEFVNKKNDVEPNFLLIPYHQVRLTGTESHVLECGSIINKWLDSFSISDQSSSTPMALCSICLDKSEYRLQACGHPYCYCCLQTYLSGYYPGRQVQIQCPVPNCGLLMLLCDIKTILCCETHMENLVKASFEAYIKANEDLIRCPGDKVSSHSIYMFKTSIYIFFYRNKFFVNQNIQNIFHVIIV